MISATTVLAPERPVEAQLQALLAQEPGVCFAYLYGSHAFHLARPDSDVDLAVYFVSPEEAEHDERLQTQLSHLLDAPVEILNLNQKWADDFFVHVLPRAVVVKDAPERLLWEMERNVIVNDEPGTREDYLEFVLASMREKSALLRQELPALDEIDLDAVLRGDKDAITYFLGTFFLAFQPLEALARRMANYIYLTTDSPVPSDLKEQIKLLLSQLGLHEEQFPPLAKMVNVRNKVAHAYWNLKDEELNNADLRAARRILDELTLRADAFVAAHTPTPAA